MGLYRATRTENRVGVGEFTRDFQAGEIVEVGDERGQVPQYICDYLVSHGILVDARVLNGPAASPLPPGPTPPAPKVEPIPDESPMAGLGYYAQLTGGDESPNPGPDRPAPVDQPDSQPPSMPKAGDPQGDGEPAKPGDEGNETPDSSGDTTPGDKNADLPPLPEGSITEEEWQARQARQAQLRQE